MARMKNTTPKKVTKKAEKVEKVEKKVKKVVVKAKAKEAAVVVDPVKRKRRSKPGKKALREIRALQKGTKLQFQKVPFVKVVREISQDLPINFHGKPIRFQAKALEALQHGVEDYLIKLFGDSYNMAIDVGNSQTLEPKHVDMTLKIRGARPMRDINAAQKEE